MRSIEEVKLELCRQWLEKADNDFKLCEHLLSDESVQFNDAIAFHAQQAAEKYLKSYLVWNQIEFPKSHDLDQLLDLVARVDTELSESLREASVLSDYSVDIRYPVGSPKLILDDARQAVELAEQVRNRVLKAIKAENHEKR